MEEIKNDVVDLGPINQRIDKMSAAFGGMAKRMEHISSRIEDMSSSSMTTVAPNKSATIGQLALALSKAQLAMGLANKSGTNGRSASAKLPDFLEIAVPALEAHELAVQFLVSKDGDNNETLTALLIHSSNEWTESTALLQVGVPPEDREFQQKRSSAITYTMRNMYRTMLCIGTE